MPPPSFSKFQPKGKGGGHLTSITLIHKNSIKISTYTTKVKQILNEKQES